MFLRVYFCHESLQKWEIEERTKKEEARLRQLKDMQTRDQQIKDTAIRKAKEAVRERRDEENMVNRVKRELQAEKDLILKRKEEHAETMKKIIEDNEKERLAKLAQSEREKQEAVEMQKAYIALMEKQERAREDMFKAMADRQAKAQRKYQATVGSSLAKQMEEDEARAAALQAEYTKLRLEKEAREKEIAIKKNIDLKLTLDAQMEHRKAQARKEKEEEMNYAAFVSAQAEKAKAEAEELKRRHKEKQMISKKELEEQVKIAAARNEETMTAIERKLNSDLLNGLENKVKIEPKVDETAWKRTPFAWKVIQRGAPF